MNPFTQPASSFNRIKALENHDATHPAEYFEQITSGTTGTLSLPAGYSVVLDQWANGVDAVISRETGGVPDGYPIFTAAGALVTTTLDAGGNWTLSGAPVSYPVDIVVAIKVTAAGPTVHPVAAYTNLMALADAAGLKIGDRYDMTYVLRFNLGAYLADDDIYEGPAEVLRLVAKSPTEFELDCTSVTRPDHYIQWIRDNNYFYGGKAQTGCIIKRHWGGATGRQVTTPFDFWNYKCRLGLSTTGKFSDLSSYALGSRLVPFLPIWLKKYGVDPAFIRFVIVECTQGDGSPLSITTGGGITADYILDAQNRFYDLDLLPGQQVAVYAPTTAGNAVTSVIISVTTGSLEFAPGTFAAAEAFAVGTQLISQERCGQIEYVAPRRRDSFQAYMPKIALQSGGWKVKIGVGNDKVVAVRGLLNADIGGDSSARVFEGVVNDFACGSNCEVYCTGSLTGHNLFEKNVYVYGSLVSCRVPVTYPHGVINGTYSNLVFGPATEGPTNHGPELLPITSFAQPDVATVFTGTAGLIVGGQLTFNNAKETIGLVTDFGVITGATYDIDMNQNYYISGGYNINLGGVVVASSSVAPDGDGWRRITITATGPNPFSLSNIDMIGAFNFVSVRRRI